MRIVIDTADCRFALHLNPRTPGTIEGDACVSRTYSALTIEQLRRLYYNTTGYTVECDDYNATLQACKYLAIRLLTATNEERNDARII